MNRKELILQAHKEAEELYQHCRVNDLPLPDKAEVRGMLFTAMLKEAELNNCNDMFNKMVMNGHFDKIDISSIESHLIDIKRKLS